MKYEYKVLPVEEGALKEEALNELGADGWRLVALTTHADLVGEGDARGRRDSGTIFTHVFIREKR